MLGGQRIGADFIDGEVRKSCDAINCLHAEGAVERGVRAERDRDGRIVARRETRKGTGAGG